MREIALNEVAYEPKKERALVLTLSFGYGHVRAAQAIAQQLRTILSPERVLLLDALDGCRFFFHLFYVWPYWAMIRHAPKLWARLFTARRHHMHKKTAPALLFEWGCAHVFRTIESFAPDVIIAVEVAACEMAALARRRGQTKARILAVITDYETEPAWVQSEVSHYAVADSHTAEQLCAWGVREDAISVTGIPSITETGSEKKALARHRLDDGRPVVLLMGGGMGPTRMDQVAAHLCSCGEPLQLIAIAGRDERARRALARLQATPPVTLHRIGWTDDVPSFMKAADVLISKPGGLTLTEAANCALPLVLYDPIPGPEEKNAMRLVECGAALLARDPKQAAEYALALLRDDARRQEMKVQLARFAASDAAQRIARLALHGEDLRMSADGRSEGGFYRNSQTYQTVEPIAQRA
jgi:processive 1,2-diacylglycerol beta-glucosyltransferase